MAELHDLSPAAGSHRGRKRVGRGVGSGLGKTAGRGQKGQKARTGGTVNIHFEGGQMPLHRRIPKRGFKSMNRVEYQVVNLRDLEAFDGQVTPEALKGAGLIGNLRRPVKVLGQGEVTKALKVEAHAFSKSAKEKIEAAGGSVAVLGSSDEG
ncbi:MAG: 50S ribosomal protein L15 [Gemmatimonadetes bacterium]|nr:50S ribosomal protein L15 [Gemmatimonadota bacterium]